VLKMAKEINLLVIDDERGHVELIEDSLEELKYSFSITHASRPSEAEALLSEGNFDLILLDYMLPGMDGLELLECIREIQNDVPVIFMTAHGDENIAAAAMKKGADDYVSKKLDLNTPRLPAAVERALEKYELLRENKRLLEELRTTYQYYDIIGKSPKMREIFKLIDKVAPSNSTILIQGESGTGKEVVARAIHDKSPRHNEPFVVVNCATLPEQLVESELFGHEKGSFTGASQQKRGKFEMADAGTIFLDEIGELTPQIQAKVLRVLQSKEFERVGGNKPVKVDVRILAATNRDIAEEVNAGNFREDLFYRLNVVPIYVPPLRERKEDIQLFITHFIGRFREENWGKRTTSISEPALKLMMEYDWRGNVRELENCIERAVLLSNGGPILPKHLPPEIRQFELNPQAIPSDKVPVQPENTSDEIHQPELKPPRNKFTPDFRSKFSSQFSLARASSPAVSDENRLPTSTSWFSLPISLPNVMKNLEEQLIRQALEEAGGIQVDAAKLLNISKNLLAHKIRKYELKHLTRAAREEKEERKQEREAKVS